MTKSRRYLQEAAGAAAIVLAAAVVSLGLGGCTESDAVRCGDDLVCARGTVCVAELGACVDPDHVAACEGLADGESCIAPGIPDGICEASVCLHVGCGNGEQEEGEVCDDGNNLSGDGCSADCTSDETCGNGIKELDEDCDCGDGSTDLPLGCEAPNSDAGGTCKTTCVLHCGDGVWADTEACDPSSPRRRSCNSLGYDRGTFECTDECEVDFEQSSCRNIGWRGMGTYWWGRRAISMVGPDQFFELYGSYNPYVVVNGEEVEGSIGNTYPNEAYDIWGANLDAGFAVGEGGTIHHWNGSLWAPHSSGTSADLFSVWGTSESDVWAVGAAGTVLHYNGVAWSPVSSSGTATDLRAVAGNASGRIVAVGDDGTLLERDGDVLVPVVSDTTAHLSGVWVVGDTAIAVGDAGTIVRNTGAGWQTDAPITTVDLNDIWGSASEGFFAVGDSGVVLFFDGTSWMQMSLGKGLVTSAFQDFWGVGGFPGEAVLIQGADERLAYEGAAWAPTADSEESFFRSYRLWGNSTADVFAIGEYGTILHFDGVEWSVLSANVSFVLNDIWASAVGEVFAVGAGGLILHYDGSEWSEMASGTTVPILGVWGRSGSDVYAVGGGVDGVVFLHYDGSAWTDVDLGPDPPLLLWDVWGIDDEVWAVGESTVCHFDGEAWNVDTVPGPHRGVWGASADAVYVVGGGVDKFYDGVAWDRGPFEYGLMFDSIWGTPEVGVIGAGKDGLVARWDGVVLETLLYGDGVQDADNLDSFTSVWADGHVIFLAGFGPTPDRLVLHW